MWRALKPDRPGFHPLEHKSATAAFGPLADILRSRQHQAMRATDYFLPVLANEADLAPWHSILPTRPRILRTSLFGDHFVVGDGGAVHMLDRGGMAAPLIASSEEDFWRVIQQDSEGWQLRPLADECRCAGKVLSDGQCYAYTTLPMLGGDYRAANIWVAPWQEWFSFTADLFQQIKDLPDGATVTLRVVD